MSALYSTSTLLYSTLPLLYSTLLYCTPLYSTTASIAVIEKHGWYAQVFLRNNEKKCWRHGVYVLLERCVQMCVDGLRRLCVSPVHLACARVHHSSKWSPYGLSSFDCSLRVVSRLHEKRKGAKAPRYILQELQALQKTAREDQATLVKLVESWQLTLCLLSCQLE